MLMGVIFMHSYPDPQSWHHLLDCVILYELPNSSVSQFCRYKMGILIVPSGNIILISMGALQVKLLE